MSDENNNSTLTPDAMVAQLRAMRQQIPNFSQLTPTQSRQLTPASTVPLDMIMAASNAIGESEVVQTAAGATVEQIRQKAADAHAWAAFEEELAVTLRGVTAANRIRRHDLGTIALQTYAVTQTLVRRPEYAHLLPHRDALRRTNRFGKPRKSDVSPSPETPPAPVPQPPHDAVTN
jgi:hypothetical protein